MDEQTHRPQQSSLAAREFEQLGQLRRKVFFSPATTGNRHLKLAYVEGAPGARGAIHTHLGEEAVFTLQGRCTITINGQEHVLEKDSAFLVPPDTEHPARVVSDEPWIAVASYCDDCLTLRKARGVR